MSTHAATPQQSGPGRPSASTRTVVAAVAALSAALFVVCLFATRGLSSDGEPASTPAPQVAPLSSPVKQQLVVPAIGSRMAIARLQKPRPKRPARAPAAPAVSAAPAQPSSPAAPARPAAPSSPAPSAPSRPAAPKPQQHAPSGGGAKEEGQVVVVG